MTEFSGIKRLLGLARPEAPKNGNDIKTEKRLALEELDERIARSDLSGEDAVNLYLDRSCAFAQAGNDQANAKRYQDWRYGSLEGKLEFCAVMAERLRRDIKSSTDPAIKSQKGAQLVGWLAINASLK